jgi:hypothetical protein
MFFAHQVSGNAQADRVARHPFDPPGTTTRTLRFVNIRVNAALATGGNVTSLVPPSVSIFVSYHRHLHAPHHQPVPDCWLHPERSPVHARGTAS